MALETPLLPSTENVQTLSSRSPSLNKSRTNNSTKRNDGTKQAQQQHPMLDLMDQCMAHCQKLVQAGLVAYLLGFWNMCRVPSDLILVGTIAPNPQYHSTMMQSMVDMIWILAVVLSIYHLCGAVALLAKIYHNYEPARGMVKSLLYNNVACHSWYISSATPLSQTQSLWQQLRQLDWWQGDDYGNHGIRNDDDDKGASDEENVILVGDHLEMEVDHDEYDDEMAESNQPTPSIQIV